MRQHQIAARRQHVQQAGDDLVRPLVVRDEVHERDERQRDRPVEVEGASGVTHYVLRRAHIGLYVVRPALGAAEEQGLGVAQHDRVVVGVDDARRWVYRLHDLVQVRLGRDAGADVQELGHAVARQPGGGAVHERPVLAGGGLRLGRQGPAHPTVDLVVVLAAEQPVVDPRGVRLAGVDLGFGRACRHDEAPMRTWRCDGGGTTCWDASPGRPRASPAVRASLPQGTGVDRGRVGRRPGPGDPDPAGPPTSGRPARTVDREPFSADRPPTADHDRRSPTATRPPRPVGPRQRPVQAIDSPRP